MDAQGACFLNQPYCPYVEGEPSVEVTASGGMVTSVTWQNGLLIAGGCWPDDHIEQRIAENISLCTGDWCCNYADTCTQNGDRWDSSACRCMVSPLFVVFRGPWQEALTSAEHGVPFLMRPGTQVVRVAWPQARSLNVGVLVRDRNRNGVIDDGSELYGSAAPQSTPPGRPRHGFTALAAEDANSDGRIDASDPAYSEIAVWFDTNHTGTTDAGEVRLLRQCRISGIDLHYRVFEKRDRHDNIFAFVSNTTSTIPGRLPARVFDVYPRTVPAEPIAGTPAPSSRLAGVRPQRD